jgi:DNA-directed RNA polymerase specialized sigma24 family protein
MTTDASITTLALSAIAQRCQQESQRYFQQLAFDARYCYELFRRALAERSEGAWELVYRQYAAQVQSWVERHPAFASSGETAEHFVNAAFAKLWSALSAQKFSHFADLKALLSYLKLCVGSVLIDHARAKAQPVDDVIDPEHTGDPAPEQEYLADEWRRAFWRRVEQRLKDDKERKLIYYRFVLDLKPREICKRFPADFPVVDEIFVMTQNIVARLRRDPELRKFLGDGE